MQIFHALRRLHLVTFVVESVLPLINVALQVTVLVAGHSDIVYVLVL